MPKRRTWATAGGVILAMAITLPLGSGPALAASDGLLSTAVYLSDGSRFPGWTQWSDRDGGWIDAAKWVSGDFNGDGKADIAAIWNNGGTNTLTVSLSNGHGFTRSHWATNAGGWSDSTQWLAGDYNGDGKSDIAASWNNGGQLSTAVYLSDGSRFPGWTQWSDRDGGWIDAAKWVSGDFNGDGKADIAAIWNNGGTNTLTVSQSTGNRFTRSHWATNAGGWGNSTQWLAGDYNGDGKSDIAASWNNGGQLSTAVYLSDGSRFPGWTQWSDRDGGWIDAAKWVSGDFNGDGKADIAASWNNGGTNTLTVSQSTGNRFTRSHWATNAGGWLDSTQWLAGDYNGDRKADIAASWNNGTPLGTAGDCQKAEEPYAGYVDKVPQTDADVVNAEHALVYLVNVERTQRGLPALCFNGQLAAQARAHSENWATNPDRACPSHNPPLVCSHWDSRAGYAWPEDRLAKSGYAATASGENTQNGGGRSDGASVVPAGWTWGTPKAAVYWWMNHNPENNFANNGHRAAILNPAFKDAGPGAGRYTDRFGNHAATFTLMFGAR